MMNDQEITALANGMAPFVRECVAEAFSKNMMVPPELAAQVASVLRILNESPEQPAMPQPKPKVTRIKRDDDGNFVVVYDERQP